MYSIEQVDYHYYHELADGINELCKDDACEFVNIIDRGSSGNPKKMHRAIILVKTKRHYPPITTDGGAEYKAGQEVKQ